jgi:hypothetical protein
LEWVEQTSFIEELNELLHPIPIKIGAHDRRMPQGTNEPREARLETFGPTVVPEPCIGESIQRWWLAYGGNTPNWDLASACTLEERRGLLLVEAKANVPELSAGGKRLVGNRPKKDGAPPKPPSERAKQNDARIRQAVAEAGRALATLNVGKAFTANSHYQLANRLAFAWKLASLGVPVTLLYLGFCGDHGIARVGAPLASKEHWYSVFGSHISACLTMDSQELRVAVNGVPMWVVVRSRWVLSQSPPIGI